MLVPLKLRYGSATVFSTPGSNADARVRKNVLPGADNETLPAPGATRSGLAAQSRYVGPRELNVAIVSSRRTGVPLVLDAPTVSTHGALPGAAMPPHCGKPAAFLPRLPAAVTTTTPLSTTRFAASVRGSVQNDSWTPAAIETFTTRILYWSWCAT